MGPLQPHDLGLVDVCRHARPVPDAAVSLPALPADDFDLRDADAFARGKGGGRMKRPSIHGLMAEFDDAQALVAATHQAHREGYRRMDAYSPFPIEELHEALGAPPSRLPLGVLIVG